MIILNILPGNILGLVKYEEQDKLDTIYKERGYKALST